MENALQVIKTLQDEIPVPNTINYGGCGIYAVEAYYALRRGGFDPQVVCLNYGGMDAWLNLEGCDAVHLMLQLGDYLFDAVDYIEANNSVEDICNTLNIYPCEDIFYVPIETVEVSLNLRGWNARFNREYYTPQIKSAAQQAHRRLRLLR